MGTQSARIYFDENDHNDIFFREKYHDKMYVGKQLVWEKIRGRKYFVTNQYAFDLIVYIDTKSYDNIHLKMYSDKKNNPSSCFYEPALCNGKTMIRFGHQGGHITDRQDGDVISSYDGVTWKKGEESSPVEGVIYTVNDRSYEALYDLKNNYCCIYGSYYYIFHIEDGVSHNIAVGYERLLYRSKPMATDGSLLLIGITLKPGLLYYTNEICEATIPNNMVINFLFAKNRKIYMIGYYIRENENGQEWYDYCTYIYDTDSKTATSIQRKEWVRCNYCIYVSPYFYIYDTYNSPSVHITDDGVNYTTIKLPSEIKIYEIKSNKKISIHPPVCIEYSTGLYSTSNAYFEDGECKGNIGHIAGLMHHVNGGVAPTFFIYIDNLFFEESDNNFALRLHN